MREIIVHQYNAFTTDVTKGNPAGVVLQKDVRTEEQMQEIAAKVGFSESVFILPSEVCDLKLRYFTPGHEVDLCGHATIASIYALKTRGLLPKDRSEITIETRAGHLPIGIIEQDDQVYITMRQNPPQFQLFQGSLPKLMAAVGLQEQDIHPNLPVMYGSTGAWTLLIPIQKLSALTKMKPHNHQFPNILREMPRVSVHPFCLETTDSVADLRGRHFLSPYSGTVEDPVTGTASGVMGAYYQKYIRQTADAVQLTIEQGYEMKREGFVRVAVGQVQSAQKIEISGTAVYVREIVVQVK